MGNIMTNQGGKLIATAFVKAQKEFGPALKSSTNPHFKSKYADLSACVEAVIDALNNNGIGMMQKLYENATGVSVETIFLHESGETLECGVLHVPASKQDPQGYGSALTYARRYSLMAACGIAPEDDDGNMASRKSESKSNVNESEMADWLEAIAQSQDLPELQKNFVKAISATDGDKPWQLKVIAVKDKMKKKLEAK
jgi:hypothetical protein